MSHWLPDHNSSLPVAAELEYSALQDAPDPHSERHILDLSPELLGKVFDFLFYLEFYQTIPRVCRAFRRAASHSQMAAQLDLTGSLMTGEWGPDRTLQSVLERQQEEGLLAYIRLCGGRIDSFRATLGQLKTPEATSIILDVSAALGPEVYDFEIAVKAKSALGGLSTDQLPRLVALWQKIHNLELPLAGPLLDEHLEAIAKTDPTMMTLSYAKALAADEHFFGFTRDGWGKFDSLYNFALIGGALHHTWGLGDMQSLDILQLSKCKQLSLAGLQPSTSLRWLLLKQPDLQHSATATWHQQLKDLPSLRHLTLDGHPCSHDKNNYGSRDFLDLFTITQLDTLTLRHCILTNGGHDLAELGTPHAPHLTSLSISGGIEWPDLNFASLPNLASLHLNLPFDMLPASMAALTRLTSLACERTSPTDGIFNGNMIGSLTSLHKLILLGCEGIELSEAAWVPLTSSTSLAFVRLRGSCPAQDCESWLQMVNFVVALKSRPGVQLHLK